MEVATISVEYIKPASPTHDLKPFKLSLLDQLTPPTYTPIIFFYPINDPHLKNTSNISNQLKTSLSRTLVPFFPLSGRIKDNVAIHNYQEGVPFIEARVKGHLIDFLRNPQLKLLNNFLPCKPFCLQDDNDPKPPLLATQLNIFDCGGIALAPCLLHKATDGVVFSSLLKSWTAINSGSYHRILQPKIGEASLLFPPLEPLPTYYTSLINKLFFKTGNRQSTRRFVFNGEAVQTLRDKCRSEIVEDPTRVEALSSFIWKYAMLASRTLSGSLRPSILVQSVNIRGRTRPPLSRYCFGNLVRSGIAYCKWNDLQGLDGLVGVIRQGIDKINGEYLKTLCGEKGSGTIFEYLREAEENSKGDLDVFTFSSWNSFGIHGLDFGWGKPIWTGVYGEASIDRPCDTNFTVLKDGGVGMSMEAWVTLDERVMGLLENDPEFMTFANSNPSVL